MSKEVDYYLSLDYEIKLHPIADEEGGGWIAKIDELEGCMADGENPNEAVENVKDAQRDWIQFCLNKGIEIPEPTDDSYSGRFTLRVPKTTHRKLTNTADKECVSINSLVNNYIVMGLQNDSITDEIREIKAKYKHCYKGE